MKKIVCLLSIIVVLGLFTSCERTERTYSLASIKKVVVAEKKEDEHKHLVTLDGEDLDGIVREHEGNLAIINARREREREERERAEREERTSQSSAQKDGWICLATAESEYVGVPKQKAWYNSDTIAICGNGTFVHIVMCNKQPRNSNSSPMGNPMVELKDGTVVKGDWVRFEIRTFRDKYTGQFGDSIWTWSIDDSLYNPIKKGSFLDVLFQVLSKQPRFGAKVKCGVYGSTERIVE